jgi:hypothetical protein
MAESIVFLFVILGTVYFLYWFWKNDDGLDAWKKKRHGSDQDVDNN